MRRRPSARLLLVDPDGRVLLFRFAFTHGPLEGMVFWATPGGELEPGESFEAGAIRELAEETGLIIDDPGPPIEHREFVMRSVEGDEVLAQERYYLLPVTPFDIADAGWTELEREVVTEHRWWNLGEIAAAEEKIFPENLTDLLAAALGSA